MNRPTRASDSRRISDERQRHQRDEWRTALRALLMSPLIHPADEAFFIVRRHAESLREWFLRETGWPLLVDRECARLQKRPARLDDATRGLPEFDRRRYVVLCLVCVVLERADAQITLRLLGEHLLQLAADPLLETAGFRFTLGSQTERRELVAVCKTLLRLGVLHRVAGDEEAFASDATQGADALYDIHRRPLANLFAGVRSPSSWPPEEAPATHADRLQSLVDEYVADSEEARRTRLRHLLTRRLLDDPVVYFSGLDEDARSYLMNQRGVLAARLCEATGLSAEQRAEGLALVDEAGELTDVAMPAEGTDAHATLLVAEYLARGRGDRSDLPALEQDVADHLRSARDTFGRFWRKSAREPGSERELASIAVERLCRLQLIERTAEGLRPSPALARFALGEPQVHPAAAPRPATTGSLFDTR